MRRALRHLFTILPAMLLLLCVGSCVLWVRSRSFWDEYRTRGYTWIQFVSGRSVLLVDIHAKFSGQNGNYNYRYVQPGDRLWLGDQHGPIVEKFHIPLRGDDAKLPGVFGFSFSVSNRTSGEGLFHSVQTVGVSLSVPL